MSGEAAPLPPDAFREPLRRASERSSTPLSPSHADSIGRYLAELDRWRRRINLTGRLSPDDLAGHALEAALGAAAIPAGSRVGDIGSGAGMPGVPLAILRGDLRVTLVEPRRKRAEFLSHVVRAVAIPNAQVWIGPAQGLSPGSFDLATMRAVGRAAIVVGEGLFLVPRGFLLAWTTRSRELARSLPAFEPVSEIAVPGTRERVIAVMRRKV